MNESTRYLFYLIFDHFILFATLFSESGFYLINLLNSKKKINKGYGYFTSWSYAFIFEE